MRCRRLYGRELRSSTFCVAARLTSTIGGQRSASHIGGASGIPEREVMTQENLVQIIGNSEPEALQHTLWQCLRGEISPAVAIMGLLIQTQDVERVANLLGGVTDRVSALPPTAGEHQRAAEIHRLFQEQRDGCARIAQMLRDGVNTGVLARSS